MLIGKQGVDEPRDTFTFINGHGERFLTINADGIQFTPPHENDTKEELAKWFVESLVYILDMYHVGNPIVFDVNNGKQRVLTLTETEIIADEPNKPFDYWTLNLAKKLWKERKRETT